MGKDIKINEAQQVKDAAYVTVVLTDGSLGKIAKNDLIELFKTSIGFNTVLQDKGEAKDDLNTYKSTGYYYLCMNITMVVGGIDRHHIYSILPTRVLTILFMGLYMDVKQCFPKHI